MSKRLRFCLAAPLAALACLALSGTALAGETPYRDVFEAGDPLKTNIPYVAWTGEEVRLMKCVNEDDSAPYGDLSDSAAEWAVVDWSGMDVQGHPSRDPEFFDDVDRRTSAFQAGGITVIGQNEQPDDSETSEDDRRTCWAIDIESQKPGLAVVKMATDDGDPPGSPELKHQFLVIWLTMNNPELVELADADFPGISLGDPDGDGIFLPNVPDSGAYGEGLIRITVDGWFPLGQNFADDLDGDPDTDVVTLPADWATLANRYAVSVNGLDPASWDIHDDQTEFEPHSPGSFCLPPKTSPIDAVDNCLGDAYDPFDLDELGPFSRLVGGTSAATLGPFDPVRPGTSYLPDGKTDAGDTPLPAARVDVTVGGNFGALTAADKHVLYSRDRTGNADGAAGAHNLYAPFYAAIIPATSTFLASNGGTFSGVHGALANNFPGFQAPPIPNVLGLYHYWDLLNIRNRGGVNDCNDVGGTNIYPNPDQGGAIARPTGPDRATVYTDEHGEAIVGFLPDVGVRLTPDVNGLCDPGEISATPRQIASATINAVAQDPFQPVFDDVRNSNTLTKNLFSLAGKSLDCHPKTPLIAICIETILDRFGNPVVGAPVLFTADATEGDPNVIGLERSIDVPGRGFNDDPGPQCFLSPATSFGIFEGTLCVTNREGQAAVEVLTSHATLVDVIAENYATRNGGFGILRDRCIRFFGDGATLPTDGPSCTNPTEPAPQAPAPQAPAPQAPAPQAPAPQAPAPQGSTASAATVVSLAGVPVTAVAAPVVKKPVAKAAALKLTSARLVLVKGKRYLVVRANGSAKTAKLRITLVMRTGQVMKPVVRTIRTNKAVRVANLQIGKHVRTVRVSFAK